MSPTASRRREAPSAEQRAEHLKERIYVTFTALAVVIALGAHVEDDTTPGTVAGTLLVTVLGTLLAVFTADFISHLVVHAQLPSRPELAHMVRVSTGALGAVVLPLVFLVLAAAGVWSVDAALRASTVALLASLVLVAYLAVRRVPMSLGQRVVVLLAELVLAVGVIALELLVH